MMKELPKRKIIRWKDYDYSQNNACYVTICIQNRQCLFGAPVGTPLRGHPNPQSEMVEKWILEIENKYENAKVDKYVIMPDHIHMIIVLTGDHVGSPLQQIIGWFKTMTTNEYIRGVKASIYDAFDKKIWQQSYYDRIIRNESEYKEIWNYIDTNSIKWQNDDYFI